MTEQTPIITSADSTLAMFADFVAVKHASENLTIKRFSNSVGMWRRFNNDMELEITSDGSLFNVTEWDGTGSEGRSNGLNAHELMSVVDHWLIACRAAYLAA